MPKSLKPIPTLYAGIEFRSRLEARWAMYFDLLGVEWIYEIEGFILKSGCYLPDFYLPKFKVFCEVKPYEYKIEERWTEFTSTGMKLILLYGKVHSGPFKIIGADFGYCNIPHEDSILVNGNELCGDIDLGEENEQFCDECNSYKF